MSRKKKLKIEEQPYYIYAKNVVEDKIVTGSLEKLACSRFLSDLERDDLYFDVDKVDKAIRFVALFKHFKGDFAGINFQMTETQTFIYANIVGFFYKSNGHRRFRQSYIQVARKYGKTALTASLSLYFLIADGIEAPSIAFCGASRDQAALAFDFTEKWSRQLDPSGKDLKILRNEIKCAINNGRMKVYSSDVKGGIEGSNFDFAIVDEYHTHPNSIVYDSVKGGMVGSQAHLAVITTAGFNLESPCYAMRNACVDTLNGVNPNDRMFAYIFEMDEGDDWENDETVWRKFQPHIGSTCSYEFMRSQVQSAKSNSVEMTSVLTKQCNVWMRSSEIWISPQYIAKATKKFEFDDFKNELCYIGIDLAQVADLCSCSFCFKRDDKYWFKTLYYLPEEQLKVSPNRELYKRWALSKELIISPGNVTDYDLILNDLMKLNSKISIGRVLFDKFNSTQFVISALENGLPMEEYSQSLASFNKPTKELQRLILSGKVVIDDNEITRWCFTNVALKWDFNENCKPFKTSLSQKIDGTISMLQSLVPWIEQRTFDGELLIL